MRGKMSGSHLSRDFFDLVKTIGESKSKQEEDRIIANEVRLLKQRFSGKNLSRKVVKESLIRLIYVEMLGHDASFAYVHAIQMTAAGDLMQKKVGYLCASLTLSPDDQFRFMLVNQLQRDLQSVNVLEVGMALIALSKLVTEEMIPALLPYVVKVLDHDQSTIRKKAVLALHRIYQLDPGSVSHLSDTFRKVLCDKDPSVMGACLCILHEQAKENPQSQKDIVGSYVSILGQVVDKKLPKDFEYHRVPAPWIQIKLLKILATLGANDQRASEQMYNVLHACMRRTDTAIYIAYAIIYECVRTVTAIYPDTALLDEAAAAIARFISNDSHNLKYLGVTGLAAIVRDHPRYAAEHQMVVLDCLEDPDETLKRKTLDLLFRMTNPVNVQVVVGKLLFFLETAVDKFLRQDLVTRISQLAERYAPDNIWFVRTMARVFELGGDLVEAEVAHNLLRLLAEGEGAEQEVVEGGEGSDSAMRLEACTIFYDNFEKSQLPNMLLKVMFWTLGEYSYLMGSEVVSEVLEVICEAANRQGMDPLTRGYAISAVMKMCAQLQQFPTEASDLVDRYCASIDPDLQQKCYEFRALAQNLARMAEVLPVDASCEDLGEPDFSFLDEFVENALAHGAAEYDPPTAEESESLEYDEEDLSARPKFSEPALKYDAYEKAAPPTQMATFSTPPLSYNAPVSAGTEAIGGTYDSTGSSSQAPASSKGLNLSGVKSVWGSSGYQGSTSSQQQQQIHSQSLPTSVAQPVGRGNGSYAPSSSSYELPRRETNESEGFRSEEIQHDSAKSRSPSPEPSRKDKSERERMAAALFEGVSSSQGTGASSSLTTASRTSRRRPQRASTPPRDVENVDLLGFGDDAGEESSTGIENEISQDTPPSSSGLDLLASLDTSSEQQVGESSDLLGSPFGGSSNQTSTPEKPLLPVEMNTSEFGQKWLSNTAETKFPVSLSGISTIHDVKERLVSTLGLACVEVIDKTQEAIFTGTKTSSDGLVLIHSKRDSSGAVLIVRSNDATLTNTIAKHCRSLLR